MALESEQQKVAHLLRRFGLGASQAELVYYGEGGHLAAIDLLLHDDGVTADPVFDFDVLRNLRNGRLPFGAIVNAWTARLVSTQHPLREKMTLFWHNHFATSAGKVKSAELMQAQNETLRTHALGKFGDLLTAVSKYPAMLIWLDNQENVAGRPNENFAREVMELFTLGIGHYSEADVREAARAFTGWSVRKGDGASSPSEFVLRRSRHDDGLKNVLGHVGIESGDDVLRILGSNRITYEHLSRKLWEWFVYPNPETHIVQRMAAVFEATEGDLTAVLRAIMTSREFYSSKAVRSIIKNPVDFVVATMRQVGFGPVISKSITGAPRVALARVANASRVMKRMGMGLFYPPDVSGWKGGPAWITTATMVERIGWSNGLFAAKSSLGSTILTPGLTVEERVRTLCGVLDADLAPDRLKLLIKVAEGQGPVTNANSGQQTANLARLIFAMPEFQFA
jgi:uncharacterized protein (DUF1800 family)